MTDASLHRPKRERCATCEGDAREHLAAFCVPSDWEALMSPDCEGDEHSLVERLKEIAGGRARDATHARPDAPVPPAVGSSLSLAHPPKPEHQNQNTKTK